MVIKCDIIPRRGYRVFIQGEDSLKNGGFKLNEIVILKTFINTYEPSIIKEHSGVLYVEHLPMHGLLYRYFSKNDCIRALVNYENKCK